jgi:hypothetical protein
VVPAFAPLVTTFFTGLKKVTVTVSSISQTKQQLHILLVCREKLVAGRTLEATVRRLSPAERRMERRFHDDLRKF